MGLAAQVPASLAGANLTQTTARIAVRGGFEARYFLHFFRGEDFRREVSRYTKGSAQPGLNLADVEKFRLVHPPLPEQRQIAAILDTLDEAIRRTEQVIEKLKQIKQGLLHDLLTRGIDDNGELRVPPDEAPHLYKDSPLGRIPRGWEVELLDDVAIRGSGHTPSKSVPSYWNGGIKWVSLADSKRLDRVYIYETDKRISDLGIANSSAVKHPAGTVILSRDAGVGKSAILASEMAVSQHFMAWHCGDRLYNLWLYYWLQYNKRRFESIAFGSTIQTIGLPFFKSLRVAVPRYVEQATMANTLTCVEKRAGEEASQLAKLGTLKLGLMDDLLTGRVRVAIPTDATTP